MVNKLSLIIFTLCFNLQIIKAEEIEFDFIKDWIDLFKAEYNRDDFLFPKSLLFISELQPSSKPEIYKKIRAKSFNNFGYMNISKTDDIEWSFKINDLSSKVDESISREDLTMTRLFALSSADLIIHAPSSSGSDWRIFCYNKGNYQEIKTKAEIRNGTQAKPIYKWLYEALGYNGIILGIEDDLYLIGSSRDMLKKGSQALVINNSSKKIKVQQDKRNTIAILKKKKFYRRFWGI